MSTPVDIHCFVFDGVSDWQASYAIAGINNPQFQREPGRYRMRAVAARAIGITTAGGWRVQPDLTLEDLAESGCTLLILPGGRGWDEGLHMGAVAAAHTVLAGGGAVAAICGATAGLARASMLDAHRHTSNDLACLQATGYRGAALYEDVAAVTDNRVITAGSTAAIDFAHQIFRHLGLYDDEVLRAWYGLYKTGKPEHAAALARAETPLDPPADAVAPKAVIVPV